MPTEIHQRAWRAAYLDTVCSALNKIAPRMQVARLQTGPIATNPLETAPGAPRCRPGPSKAVLVLMRSAGSHERVRVAVVGLGRAGEQHAAVLAGLDTATVTAGVDLRAGRAAQLGLPERGLPAALDDVDLVAVCLPPGQRGGIVEAAFAAGAHVLLEKPPAADPAELTALLQRATGANRLAAVMFQHRFALPDAVLRHDFGAATATLLVARPRPERHYTTGWRADRFQAGGGATAHLGAHYLDLACQILGMPAEVSVLRRRDAAAGIDVELAARVSFGSGSELMLEVTSTARHRTERLRVRGEHGWLEVTDGATSASLGGVRHRRAARPAAQLRAEVYRELIAASYGHRTLDWAALARSVGVSRILHSLQQQATAVRP